MTFRIPAFWLTFCLALAFILTAALRARAADVALEWDANSEPDLAGYRLHWGTTSGTYTAVKDVGKSTTALATDLLPGGTYYFAVVAYNTEQLVSLYSNEVIYTVPPASVVLSYNSGQRKFTWTDSVPAPAPPLLPNTYIFEQADSSGNFTITRNTGTIKEEPLPAGLLSGVYTFRVTAVDPFGAKLAPSNIINVTIPNAPKKLRMKVQSSANLFDWKTELEIEVPALEGDRAFYQLADLTLPE